MILFEKYRPQTFGEIIHDQKDTIQQETQNPLAMPHFLFISRSPGTGKTSMAHVIRRAIGTPISNFMILNSSEDRKLDTIRGKVLDFARSKSTNPDAPRIILMDEADGMLSQTQNALRNIMETYSSNCKFILTANYENKIIDPIRSRCSVIYFTEPNKEQVFQRLKYICEQEKVTYTDEALAKIISLNYPDMRAMINEIQRLAIKGITVEIIRSPTHLEEEFYGLLKAKRPFDARKFAVDKGLDPESLVHYCFERTLGDDKFLLTHSRDNEGTQIRELVYWTAEISYRMGSRSAHKDIQLMAWILKWSEVFR